MGKMKIFFISALLLFGVFVGKAQTQPPKGPAADKAIKAYSSGDIDQLAKDLPAMVSAFPSHPFTIFFKAYLADRKDNNVQEALKGYSEVIKVAPDLMEPFFFRALIFNEKGMYEKAIDDMTNAIKNDDQKLSNLYTLRGEIYSKAKKENEAYEDFKTAISISPEIVKNYIGLSNMAFYINKSSEALKIIENAANGSQSINPGLICIYASTLLKLKKFEESDQTYDRAFKLPKYNFYPENYNDAAIAALNTNNISKAKQLAEKAVATDPSDHSYYCTRAEISISDKTWEEVYTWAKKALAINAKSARANMLMAVGVKLTNRGDALSAEYEKKAKQLDADGVLD